MSTLLTIGAGLLGAGLVYYLWRTAGRTYRRYRGKMLVTCPETGKAAGVDVSSGHAAATAVAGALGLRLSSCTRWPERQHCGQECLTQIEKSPEACLVRNMLADWYRQRSCVYCGKAFREIESYDHRVLFGYDHKPALLSQELKLLELSSVPVETLNEVLETHQPVCWDCLVAETFRLEHPDRVTARPGRPQ